MEKGKPVPEAACTSLARALSKGPPPAGGEAQGGEP